MNRKRKLENEGEEKRSAFIFLKRKIVADKQQKNVPDQKHQDHHLSKT
jgi:hypothetical protein